MAEGQALADGNFPTEIGDVELPEFHLPVRDQFAARGWRRWD